MADAVFKTEITAERAQFDAQMDAAAQKSLSTAQSMQSAFREAGVRVSDSVKHATDTMNRQFDQVKAGIEKLRGVFAGIAAVVGGGALFGSYISKTAEATSETAKLSRMLGITTQEATTLRIALGDIGTDTDMYVGALSKMTMKLREGEERFNALGIQTRDQNGNLLDAEKIMQNALQAMMNFKAGTDRNLASTEVFAKGWAETSKLLRLTPAIMEEARQKAEDLQLTVGPKGAERARQYKQAMNDFQDVVEAIGNRIAQAVMPALTDFANWLSSAGPMAVTVMRGAIGGLMSAFYALQNGVVVVVRVISAALFTIVEPLAAVAEAIYLSLTGNFSAAAARLKAIPSNISSFWSAEFEEILKSGDKTRERIAALFDFSAEQGSGAPARGGTRGYTPAPEKGKEKSRMSEWEAELAAARDAFERMMLERGSFQEFSKEQERDFWKEKLKLRDLSQGEESALLKKFYASEREIRKEAFEREQADIKARIEAHKQGSQERIRLADDAARRIGEKYGLESKEYRQARAEVEKYQREALEQARQLQDMELDSFRQHQLHRVELEKQHIEHLASLGAISERDKLARLRDLKEIEYQAELSSLQQKAELYRDNVIKYREMLEQIEQLQRRHQLDMRGIGNKIQTEQFRPWKNLFDAITGGFSTAIKGVIMGTQTLGQATMNILQTVALAVLDMGVKMVAQWLMNMLIGKAIDKQGALGKITDNAAVAASAAYASTAAIPYVGPFLAPAAAAAAFAATMSWAGALAAAAQGYDVPAGVNPMTQLHEKEMVLPAHIAEPLRAALAGGGGLGGGGAVHLHVHSPDVKGVRDWYRSNASAIAPGLRKVARNFMMRR